MFYIVHISAQLKKKQKLKKKKKVVPGMGVAGESRNRY